MADDLVVLLDVDNTLLDNDGLLEDLRRHLAATLGEVQAHRYWICLEELRVELGYVDYLGALQRYRLREKDGAMHNPHLLQMSSFLLDYPFAERLYAGALRTVEHLSRLGKTVILSDGDVVFQPRKVQRSGLWQAVDGRVLIYVHKELMIDAVVQRFPARHYVMVDDKVRILSAMKEALGERVTTVFPRQGHYAVDRRSVASYPAPDITVASIDDLAHLDLQTLLGPGRGDPAQEQAHE